MPLRLGAAAAAAAILATLAVMILRSVLDPQDVPDIAAREAFLFNLIGIGLAGGLVLQLAFHLSGIPGYGGGLAWGAAGFVAVVLAPLLSMPDQPAAAPPLEDGGALLFWLFTVLVSAAGLWLLLVAPGHRRLFGLALLLTPPLMAPAAAWHERTSLADPRADPLADLQAGSSSDPLAADAALIADPILLVGLNLLFWLLLGVFSVLAARRIVQR